MAVPLHRPSVATGGGRWRSPKPCRVRAAFDLAGGVEETAQAIEPWQSLFTAGLWRPAAAGGGGDDGRGSNIMLFDTCCALVGSDSYCSLCL